MKQLLRSINSKEWRFVFLMGLLMVTVTAVPYLYGYFTTPAGMVYTGLHHFTPGDTNVFLSMIEQVRQGHPIFINLYTAEPQHRIYVNPLWLSVGLLAKLTGASGLLALHLVRSLLIVVFVVAVYLLIVFFFQHRKHRALALLMVLFSSGLGVFFSPFFYNPANINNHPTDIWVAESITFSSLYHSPHLVASLTCIVVIFLLMLLAFRTNQYRYSVSAGIISLLLMWFHPFNSVTIFTVLGAYIIALMLWQRRILWSYGKHFAMAGLLTSPAALYLFLINRADWVIHQWNIQNILPSPQPLMYLIGYGLVGLLAVGGLWLHIRRNSPERLFVVVWAVTSILLLYVPLSFQRRLSEGLHLPLALLATVAVLHVIERLKPSRAGALGVRYYAFIFLLIIFLPLTNVQILGQDIYLYATYKTLPYYLYDDEVVAMQWLKTNTSTSDVIFSAFNSGNFIPAYSGRIVWLGHGPQTANLADKKVLSEWFWRDDGEAIAKYDFLRNNRIQYVYYGRYEAGLGSYEPSSKYYLQKIFSTERAEIYEVRP